MAVGLAARLGSGSRRAGCRVTAVDVRNACRLSNPISRKPHYVRRDLHLEGATRSCCPCSHPEARRASDFIDVKPSLSPSVDRYQSCSPFPSQMILSMLFQDVKRHALSDVVARKRWAQKRGEDRRWTRHLIYRPALARRHAPGGPSKNKHHQSADEISGRRVSVI